MLPGIAGTVVGFVFPLAAIGLEMNSKEIPMKSVTSMTVSLAILLAGGILAVPRGGRGQAATDLG